MYILPSHIYKISTINENKINITYFHNQIQNNSFYNRVKKHNKPISFDETTVFSNDVIHNITIKDLYWKNDTAVWNIYDPRGFRTHIKAYNFDIILKYCDINKKHISGNLIYAWNRQGTAYILPIESSQYIIANDHQKLKDYKIPIENINPGDIIKLLNGKQQTYLGKIILYGYNKKTKKSIYRTKHLVLKTPNYSGNQYYIAEIQKSTHISSIVSYNNKYTDINNNRHFINNNIDYLSVYGNYNIKWLLATDNKDARQEITLIGKLQE